MKHRPTFRGTLQIALLSVRVKAYTTSASSSEPKLVTLHDDCKGRIRHPKRCEACGDDIARAEIVRAHEYDKGQYVTITDDELDSLAAESDLIRIESCVNTCSISLMAYSGKRFYVVPDGDNKAYNLIRNALAARQQSLIGSIVLSKREVPIAIRPWGKLLVADVLYYSDEQKRPEQFELDIEYTESTADDKRLLDDILDTLPVVQIGENPRTAALRDLIDRKIAGLPAEPSVAPEPAIVPNSMLEQLRESLKEVNHA